MVNFELNEERKMIQGSIREFATEVLRPGARDWEEGKMIPNEVIQQAWELGIITNQVPRYKDCKVRWLSPFPWCPSWGRRG